MQKKNKKNEFFKKKIIETVVVRVLELFELVTWYWMFVVAPNGLLRLFIQFVFVIQIKLSMGLKSEYLQHST